MLTKNPKQQKKNKEKRALMKRKENTQGIKPIDKNRSIQIINILC